MSPSTLIGSAAVPEETAEELYEHAPCGYMSALADGTIVRVNQTLLDWTGYSRESLLGKQFRDLLPLPGRVFYETHYDPLLRMQGFIREMALELVCAGGESLPVLVNAVRQRNAAGHSTITRTSIFDATERRTYEKELLWAKRRAEQLATVVESSADAILLTAPDGTVQTWNAAAERVFGYSAEEAVGTSVRELIVPEEYAPHFEEVTDLVRSGHRTQFETVCRHKTGARLDVSVSLTAHIEPPGELVAIAGIFRDVTERRRLESRLRQAQELQSIATLAGGVAHEVNNQMAVVLGFGHYVLKALGPDHHQVADVQAMVGAASKAADISQRLLAFSRQLPIVRREVRLPELLEKVRPTLVRLLGEDKSLVIDTSHSHAQVYADPGQIEESLVQLTSNARDAMSAGGRLTMSVRDSALTDPDAAARPGDDVRPGDYVLLEASDTGRGMDSETLRRAFEPFFTTKRFGEGRGLGLATVHGIVKQHGGHVWATSQLGRGTTIQVFLPVRD